MARAVVATTVALGSAALMLHFFRRHRRHAEDAEQVSPTTLDPKNSQGWTALRAVAHRLLDATFDAMEAYTKGRCWTPPPSALKDSLQAGQPVPTEPMPHTELCQRLTELLPYGVGNTHPRFFGWVHGSGNAGGVLADMVAVAMNANCGGRDHAAIYVERQVLDWCRAIMGFPAGCGGLLCTGTSMATLVALKAARDAKLGFKASREAGLSRTQQTTGELVGYAGDGVHSCVKRAFDLLGLGSDQLRLVPSTAAFTMDLTKLEAMVDEDTRAGRLPFLVVGTAGAVNTGAIDDLHGLAELASKHHLWFHVDGAFGACAVLADEARPLLKGMERASSLAFDLHKWLHVTYDCGCVLVRDHDAHLRAFSERPDYLAVKARGIASNNPWPTDYGIELSRGFRALKAWAHLLEHGTTRLGAAISANLAHARHLAQLVDGADGLERLAPTTLQIVVFRYVPSTTSIVGAALDALNEEIVIEIQERGLAAPSTTRIRGATAIRVNLTNHRTRFDDLDLLVGAVQRIGAELALRTAANNAAAAAAASA